jgi:hypothetical protein
MTSGTGRAKGGSVPSLGLSLGVTLALSGCAGFVEVPVQVPLQSKIDVGSFRRVLVAGFVGDLSAGDVDVASETARLLQNQLHSNSKLQVLEPDRPPIYDMLDQIRQNLGEGDRYTQDEKEQYALAADQALEDAAFWRKVGEEFQSPLIITGRVRFEEQNRSGYQAEERVVRDASNRPRLIRQNRYLERKGFSLDADFLFVDGRSGEVLHKESFTEEVLYGADQKVSPLSSYFELMDRLLPNFLGVISPQRIRGTRILLQ